MKASTKSRATLVTTLVFLGLLASPAWAQLSYTVDTFHSTVIFRLMHMKASYFYGRFREVSGEFTLDDKNPENSSIKVSVKVDGVKTDHGDRDQEIKSANMLDAKGFPTIDFVSREIKKSGENKFTVTGDMTLHGVTKELTVELERVGESDTRMGRRAGIHTVFTIKRSDYGMGWMQDALGDEVQLIVSLEGLHH